MQSMTRTATRSKGAALPMPMSSIEGLPSAFTLDLQKFLIEKNIMGGQYTAGHGENFEFSACHRRFHRTQPPLLDKCTDRETYRNRLLKRVNNPMIRWCQVSNEVVSSSRHGYPVDVRLLEFASALLETTSSCNVDSYA